VGTAARMRESSTTRPSERGTLKSTRKKTRLPRASSSRIVRFPVAEMMTGAIRRSMPAGRAIGLSGGRSGVRTGTAAGRAATGFFGGAGGWPGFPCGRFAGRLDDGVESTLWRAGGVGAPVSGFACGRFAGRLGARCEPVGRGGMLGFPGRGASGFTTDDGFACTGFAVGFAARFTTGVAVAFLATLALVAPAFDAGAGLVAFGSVPLKRRERMFFFSATCRHQVHKICHSATVPPFVVVPGGNLQESITNKHRARCVDDCGARITAEV